MRRLMLLFFALSLAAPMLAACAPQQPAKVPILSEPGKYKTCPGGGTNC